MVTSRRHLTALVKLLSASGAATEILCRHRGIEAHLGREEAVTPLLAMLRENNDRDAHLRHAAVMGLVGSHNFGALMAAANDPSPAVRLGVLLSLRRMKFPEIAQFLNDSDPHLVSEAAHAINDVPIPDAYPALASLLERTNLPETISMRAVNAAFRVGTPKTAQALAVFAARNGTPDWVRAEALNDLGSWDDPDPLDRVMHMYWPLPKRDEAVARQAAGLAVAQILHPTDGAKVPDAVRKAAVMLIKTLKIDDTAVLFDLVSGKKITPPILGPKHSSALADRNDPKLEEAVKIGLADFRAAVQGSSHLLAGQAAQRNAADSQIPGNR